MLAAVRGFRMPATAAAVDASGNFQGFLIRALASAAENGAGETRKIYKLDNESVACTTWRFR